MLPYRRTRVQCLLAVALATAVAGPADSSSHSRDDIEACPSAVKIRTDGWAQILSPPYGEGEGPPVVTSFAFAPGIPGRLYVSNGKTVKVSTDSGCSWERIYGGASPAQPVEQDVEPQRIAALVAPASRVPGQATVLWIAGYDRVGTTARPRVFRSADASATPTGIAAEPVELSTGLPAVGLPVKLVVSGVNPASAFLLVEEPDPAGTAPVRRLYRTRVAAVATDDVVPEQLRLRWENVPLPDGWPSFDDVALNPASYAGIVAWRGNEITRLEVEQVSDETETVTWQRVLAPPGRITTVAFAPGSAIGVFFEERGAGRVAMSFDGLVTLNQAGPLPDVARAAAFGTRPGVLAIHGPRGVHGFDVGLRRWLFLTPRGNPAFTDLDIAKGVFAPLVFGVAGTSVFRYDLQPDEYFRARSRKKVRYVPGTPPVFGRDDEARFVPPVTEITVAPGETVEEKVRFVVPPQLKPIDVYFVLDLTSSMAGPLDGVRKGVRKIAETLEATNADVWFGLGAFRDYTSTGIGAQPEPGEAFVYRRIVPMTGDRRQIEAGLAAARTGTGGDDGEAQTIALTQAVRGDGYTRGPTPVLGDQDANFRTDSFKVIVFVTNSFFNATDSAGAGEFSYLPKDTYPTLAQTVRDLRSYETAVVGIVSASPAAADPELARADMAKVVGGLGVVAPPQGVDCDGDGFVDPTSDVAGGEPLVCVVPNSATDLGPHIVNLLLNVVDRATVEVAISGDRSMLVAPVAGVKIQSNIRRLTDLAVPVRVGCGPEQLGRDATMRLTGSVGNVVRAEGLVVVRCRGPVPVPPVPPRDPIPPLPPVVRALPPVVVPPPVPPPLTAPNNPIPNANPNAGFASQEEQQFQLATVGQGNEETQEEEAAEFAMSGVADDSAAAARLVLGAAFVCAAAVGVAVRRRGAAAGAAGYATASRRR